MNLRAIFLREAYVFHTANPQVSVLISKEAQNEKT